MQRFHLSNIPKVIPALGHSWRICREQTIVQGADTIRPLSLYSPMGVSLNQTDSDLFCSFVGNKGVIAVKLVSVHLHRITFCDINHITCVVC